MSDYPIGMTLRPITVWPRAETRSRQRSQFSAPWRATLNALDRELVHLGGGRHRAPSVLQIAMREQDFRLDGLPRANAIPSHPGVILNIEPANRPPLSMPCDKFDRWTDNLRAIALSLEALRKIERYGTTPGNEQYRGWQAIEAKPAFDSSLAALDFLCGVAGVPADGGEDPASVYRKAAFAAHPDRGGSRELFDQVQAARDLLRRTGDL